MSLFQKSVEKKYLNELESALIDQKFAEFQDYFWNTEIQENIIEKTDKEIDQIVYELYSLSADEVEIVEGS